MYLAIVSFVAALLFCYDKRAAIRHRRRIPEVVLHVAEAIGGVFVILIFMYVIRHKNRKFAYYGITYLIFAGWLAYIALKYFVK